MVLLNMAMGVREQGWLAVLGLFDDAAQSAYWGSVSLIVLVGLLLASAPNRTAVRLRSELGTPEESAVTWVPWASCFDYVNLGLPELDRWDEEYGEGIAAQPLRIHPFPQDLATGGGGATAATTATSGGREGGRAGAVRRLLDPWQVLQQLQNRAIVPVNSASSLPSSHATPHSSDRSTAEDEERLLQEALHASAVEAGLYSDHGDGRIGDPAAASEEDRDVPTTETSSSFPS